MTAARPGSLEWLAAHRPDDLALADPAENRTRAQWNRSADALAHGLATEHAVGPGDRVLAAMPNGVALFELTFALAKLGAAPVALPLPGALDPGDTTELVARHAGAPPRLAGDAPTPTSVAFTAGRTTGAPRAVQRPFDPERTAAMGVPLADLLRRTRAQPGDVHLMAAPNHLLAPMLHANLALVRAGSVVLQPAFDPEGWLALVAGHGVTSAWLTPEMLAALAGLPLTTHEHHDTSSLNAIVTGGGPVSEELAAQAADLFGEDVLAVTYGSAETGEVAVDGHVLDAVAVEILDGVIHVESPLAVDGRATAGDRGHLDADGLLHVTR